MVDGQELDRRVQLGLRLARLAEPPTTFEVEAARARVARQARAFRGRPIHVARVEPVALPRGVGARLYVHDGAEGAGVLVYFHGGPVAVGGDSAGANLAAGVSLLAGPKPAFQLLLYPWLDLSAKRPSYRLFDGFFLTEQQLDWYREQYLTDPADALDPRCSPLLADVPPEAPRAYVMTAGFDPLRDDGEAYVERLRATGVSAALHRQRGLVHGFVNAGGSVDVARDALIDAAGALRMALS